MSLRSMCVKVKGSSQKRTLTQLPQEWWNQRKQWGHLENTSQQLYGAVLYPVFYLSELDSEKWSPRHVRTAVKNPNLLLDYRSFLQISNRFLEGLTWIQKNDKSSVRAESMSAHLLLLQLWAQRPTHGRQTTSVEVKNWRANKEPSLQEMLSSVLSRQGAQVTDHWSLGLLTSMAFSYSCYLNMEFLSQFSTIMILIDINQRECLLLSIIHVMITTLRARTKANQNTCD